MNEKFGLIPLFESNQIGRVIGFVEAPSRIQIPHQEKIRSYTTGAETAEILFDQSKEAFIYTLLYQNIFNRFEKSPTHF